jgi:hypothetical protein
MKRTIIQYQGWLGRRAGPPESSVVILDRGSGQDRKNDRGPDRPKQFGPKKIVGPARPSWASHFSGGPIGPNSYVKLGISLNLTHATYSMSSQITIIS